MNDMKTNTQGQSLDEMFSEETPERSDREEVECKSMLDDKDRLIHIAASLLECRPLLKIMGEIEGCKTISTSKLQGKLLELDDYLRIQAVEIAKISRRKEES
jgi:hypothetical protein